nr:putative ribonuclease H-like domain-containing protein [Tanacetum cinerariifolium]
MIDYAMWEVIKNGATLLKTQVVEGVVTVMPITTTKEKVKRRLEVKARSTLMMGIPNEHQLKFNSIKDAKQLLEAVEKKFRENAATKKTLRNLLNTNRVVNTAQAVNTAHGVSTASTQVNVDLEQIHPNDMEEIDLRWQMAILTMRATRFLKKTGRNLTVNGNETIGFDKSNVECYNFHKRGHFASDQAEEGPNYALVTFSSSSSDSKISNDSTCSKSCLKTIKLFKSQNEQLLQDLNKSELMVLDYKIVPRPYTGKFMPPTPDLSFTSLDEFFNKPAVENYKAMSSEEEPKTRPCAKKNMVPRAVLMKSGLVLVNTARRVNAAYSKITVNAATSLSYLSKTTRSTVKRPIHKNTSFKNGNINQRVNTIKGKHVNIARPKAVVNVVKGNNFNVVMASACWVWKPKTKVLDHVSKHNSASITLKKFDYVDSQGRSNRMKKMYCLVVTYDYSRFTWVFFLDTKDETSGILKSFITGIENLVDHKVKVIRCDNGTEFKSREMNQFCEMKGILRQFSVARTPQQNGVAESRNKTLIEAAKTMLADSKLPTTFWAEAINTACYVQNRVLVVKPHNKTSYELFHGRTPTLNFMRPFGYLVTILNTIDHLDKFNGKADEGFFVGHSLNSKAFRVFNSRTKIVEENLHTRFSEITPNVLSSGPDWIFDIDALTRTMNYEPIVAVNQQPDFSRPDSGLIVSVFQKGDDPIDAINYMMSFLTRVVTSRYLTTNNQLRNSSNPRKQATITNERVTLQPIQGRQTSLAAGTIRTYTPGASGNNYRGQRTIICYNCKGEGHMSKQCTKPKRKHDNSWFKDKVLLIQAQANDQILHEEELAFLADPRIVKAQATKAYVIESQQEAVQNSNSLAQQDALILSVIEQSKTQVVNCIKINLANKSVIDTLTAELERYKEQVKVLKDCQNVDLKSKDNVSDSCAQSAEIDHHKKTLSEHLKEKESLMQTVTLLKMIFKKEESKNIDREIALEKRIKQLNNIDFKKDQPA